MDRLIRHLDELRAAVRELGALRIQIGALEDMNRKLRRELAEALEWKRRAAARPRATARAMFGRDK